MKLPLQSGFVVIILNCKTFGANKFEDRDLYSHNSFLYSETFSVTLAVCLAEEAEKHIFSKKNLRSQAFFAPDFFFFLL